MLSGVSLPVRNGDTYPFAGQLNFFEPTTIRSDKTRSGKTKGRKARRAKTSSLGSPGCPLDLPVKLCVAREEVIMSHFTDKLRFKNTAGDHIPDAKMAKWNKHGEDDGWWKREVRPAAGPQYEKGRDRKGRTVSNLIEQW